MFFDDDFFYEGSIFETAKDIPVPESCDFKNAALYKLATVMHLLFTEEKPTDATVQVHKYWLASIAQLLMQAVATASGDLSLKGLKEQDIEGVDYACFSDRGGHLLNALSEVLRKEGSQGLELVGDNAYYGSMNLGPKIGAALKEELALASE